MDFVTDFSTSHENYVNFGPLAQLARAPALQAGGQGFESLKVHNCKTNHQGLFCYKKNLS